MKKHLISALAAMAIMPLAANAGESPQYHAKAHNPVNRITSSRALKQVTPRTGNEFEVIGVKPLSKTGVFQSAHSFSIPAVNSSHDPMRVKGESAPVRGAVLFSANWEDGIAVYGLYDFATDHKPQAATPVVTGEDWYANAGAVYAGRKFMSINKIEYYGESIVSGYIYNTDTWERENIVYLDPYFQALDMAYDPTTGNIYGAFMDMYLQAYTYGSFDINNGQYTMIRNLGRGTDSRWSAVGCDASGQLWAVSNSGTLLKVDKHTGATETIGSTGISSNYMTSGAIDPTTGTFYYAQCTDHDNILYTIDTATAKATKVYDLPGLEQVVGMYVPVPLAADKALSEVTDLKLGFSDASLTGTVSFKIPATTFSGETTLGQAEWIIRLNGNEVAKGTAACGTEVTETVTVPAAGLYTVSVVARNEAGDSPVTKTDKWIGKDVPSAVTNLRLSYADGNFNLTWSPAKPSHNAYFEPENVTYTVTRLPEGKVVSTGQKATSFSEPISVPEARVEFQYSVTAEFDGATSAPALSNIYPLGVIVPPYLETFDSADAMLPFTIIDVNGDNVGWDWFSGQARMSFGRESVDDWLIAPVMKFTAGNAYFISLDAKCYNPSYPERVAVYVGKSPTPEAMTTTVIAPTLINEYDAVSLRGIFVPETDGEYYIGIHGCSDPMQYYLYIDNLAVAEPMTAATPKAVENLTATAAAEGELAVTLTFKTPQTDVAGNPLPEALKVAILRDDVVIETLNATPGENKTYTDNKVTNGTHSYAVVTLAGDIQGLGVRTSVFVGYDAPNAVTGFSIKPGNGNSEVVLNWNAVTTDVRGTTVAPGKVTYTISRFIGNSEKVVKTGLTECTFTDMPLDDDEEQMFVQYAIMPVIGNIAGDYAISEMYPVGMPYELPFVENFAGLGVGHIWAVGKESEISTAAWEIVTEDEWEIPSADGDGVLLAFTSGYTYDDATFYSGKIAIPSKAVNPRLSFYCYGIDDGTNSFDILIDNGGGFKSAMHLVAGNYDDWKRYSLDLGAYRGQNIRVAFKGVSGNYDMTPFDDIAIAETPDHNLRARSLAAPAKAMSNEKVEICAQIENIGMKAASGYSVTLMRGSDVVATLNGPEIAPDGSAIVKFTNTLSAAADSQSYQAVVEYASDQNAGDNTSPVATIEVVQNPYPTTAALNANETASGVELTWQGPDFNNMPYIPVTESFEDYANLSYNNIGDWTLVDCDGVGAGGIQGEPLEGIDGQAVPFFIMDGSIYGQGFEAHSGNKFMCSMWVHGNSTKADDWMISPELTGEAQTISFHARSYHPLYPESFQILYSTTGKETDDFTPLAAHTITLSSWTEFTADLPEGARYFAIRCISDDSFMLFVDDVTFIPAIASRWQLEFEGYNVYRNGVRINADPLATPAFTDPSPVDGVNTYVTTVLYKEGESAPCEAVSIGESGLDTVTAGTVSISVQANEIVVSGAAGLQVSVSATDGRVLYNAKAADVTRIAVERGVYIVTAGRTIRKVAVDN